MVMVAVREVAGESGKVRGGAGSVIAIHSTVASYQRGRATIICVRMSPGFRRVYCGKMLGEICSRARGVEAKVCDVAGRRSRLT